MKVLKTFANVIIGIILFALIFTLIFVRETNKIISSDVLEESVKNIVSDISDDNKELTDSQKETIDNIFKDNDAKEIATLILENYKKYHNNENYAISSEDAKKFYDYLYKYKDDIRDSKIEMMNDEEFREYFNNEKINKMANDTFKDIDKLVDSKVLDKILDGYSIATSYYVRLAILFVIVSFIILLCLINLSLIKWMVIFGISLIASGCLFNTLYSGAELVKEFLLKDNINISLNLNSFLFVGVIQIVLGIMLIIIHYILKNKLNDSVIK